jgi:hypothetical protein
VVVVQRLSAHISRGLNWIELLEQAFNTLSELCQGNQESQKEALDNQILSTINTVLGFDSAKESELKSLTGLKRAALSLLEAFLEQNNDAAKENARLVYNSLNLGVLIWSGFFWGFLSLFLFNTDIHFRHAVPVHESLLLHCFFLRGFLCADLLICVDINRVLFFAARGEKVQAAHQRRRGSEYQ